jgi:NTP pyrophosphatase (non-canonical NTP hydrolase)
MTFEEYEKLAARTFNGENSVDYGVLAVAGEAGELVEVLKKWRYHHSMTLPEMRDCMAEEMGDVLWGLAYLAHSLGLNLSDIASDNNIKLKLRYPLGFIPGGGIR